MFDWQMSCAQKNAQELVWRAPVVSPDWKSYSRLRLLRTLLASQSHQIYEDVLCTQRHESLILVFVAAQVETLVSLNLHLFFIGMTDVCFLRADVSVAS